MDEQTKQAIFKLFKDREKAIITKDKELFLSTQVFEIPNYWSIDYFDFNIFKTEVVTMQTLKDYAYENVVFGREVYAKDSGDALQERFLIYRLINTVRGWRIYHIVY